MKITTRLLVLLCALMTFTVANAQNKGSTVRMRTSAKVGDVLRIYATPFNGQTVSGGVENADFFGEYRVTDPSKDIVIEGELDNLEVYGCSLTDIFFDKAPELSILKCYENNLTTLDVSNCPKLSILYCNDNQIRALDVSANPNIEKVECANNQLTSLNLGNASHLKRVDCCNNQLTTVNTASCPELEDFYAAHNQFESLNLSANKKLWWIKAFCNKIDKKMDTFVANLPKATQSMSILYIIDSKEAGEANRMSAKQVNAALEKGWLVCDYMNGIETSESLIGAVYRGYDYVPSYGDNVLTLSTNKQVGESITLKISSTKDVLIEGVKESAPYIGQQTYTLTSQTLTIKGSIDKFECTGQRLSSLTFEGTNSPLKELICSNNELTELVVRNMKSLEKIECQENKIAKFMVTGCDALFRIDSYRNNLNGSAMSMFLGSLYDDTKKQERNEPVAYIIDSKAPEGMENNLCYKDDIQATRNKGWKLKDYINGGNWGFGQDIIGEDKELPDQYVTIETLSDYISVKVVMKNNSSIPMVEGAEIMAWNENNLMLKMQEGGVAKVYGDITELFAPISAIDAINVDHLTSLTTLHCGFNNISTLDLSKNANLQVLSCEGNKLTSLDLTGTSVYSLICYANNIEGEAMTALVNSLPEGTEQNKGIIVVVDGSFKDEVGMPREHNICLTSDIEAAKKRMWVVCDLNGGAETLREYTGYDGEFLSTGLGFSYSMKELSRSFGSGVEDKGDNTYNVTKPISILAGDNFNLEDQANVTMQTGAVMNFYGEAAMRPKNGATFHVAGIEEGEWGGLYFKECQKDVHVSKIDFKGIVVKYGASGKFFMDHCSLSNTPACKLSKNGSVNISFASEVNITNSTFTDNEHPGISTGANTNAAITIEGCTFKNNTTLNRNQPQINISTGGDLPVVVRNNTVIGNPELTMVGGISVSNMMGKAGENYIELIGNTVTDNRYGITVLGKSNSIIKDNILKNNDKETNPMNGGSGISLYDSNYTGLKSHVEGNVIEGSLWGITVIGCTDVNIGKTCVGKDDPTYNRGGNVFKNNGNNGVLYDLYNNSNRTVYAQGNTWNVEEQTQEAIETVIFHKHDDESLGEVIFWNDGVGIENVENDDILSNIVAIYDINGVQRSSLATGLNIVRYANGTVKKIYIR